MDIRNLNAGLEVFTTPGTEHRAAEARRFFNEATSNGTNPAFAIKSALSQAIHGRPGWREKLPKAYEAAGLNADGSPKTETVATRTAPTGTIEEQPTVFGALKTLARNKRSQYRERRTNRLPKHIRRTNKTIEVETVDHPRRRTVLTMLGWGFIGLVITALLVMLAGPLLRMDINAFLEFALILLGAITGAALGHAHAEKKNEFHAHQQLTTETVTVEEEQHGGVEDLPPALAGQTPTRHA